MQFIRLGVEVTRRAAPSRLERGTSTVELALIIPVFLLMILGVFDLSWMVVLSNMTGEAAREGARAAIVLLEPDATGCPASATTAQTASIVTAAHRHVLSYNGSTYNVGVTSGGDVAQGCFVQVQVTTMYSPVTGSLLPVGPRQVGATSRLKLA